MVYGISLLYEIEIIQHFIQHWTAEKFIIIESEHNSRFSLLFTYIMIGDDLRAITNKYFKINSFLSDK